MQKYERFKITSARCRISKNFDDTELFEEIFEDSNSTEDLNNDILLTISLTQKPGARLPKTEDQWKLANLYFQSTFSILTFHPDSIDANIALMNTTIYNYFRDTYGIIEDPVNTEPKDKYKDSSIRVLKRDLKNLENINTPVHEIQYVARLILGRLANPKSTGTSSYADHDKSITRRSWDYVKRTIKSKP